MFSPMGERAYLRAKILLGTAVLAVIACSASAAPMSTGSLTSQPIGHYEFCKANPSECVVRTSGAAPERMTELLWQEVVAVNMDINDHIKPVNDVDLYGKDEVWAYPAQGQGDCEDYVLAKRRALEVRGLSIANLLITVVKKPDGEGHAVLTVRTDRGDYILDNLTDAVRAWEETGYRFLKRQASDNTGRWVAIREGQAPMVGSVRSVR